MRSIPLNTNYLKKKKGLAKRR